MPRLVLSTPALRDLAAIEERVEQASGSGEAAESFVKLIVNKCNRLASFETRVGRPRPELLPDLRSFPFYSYVIFFRYAADSFYVVNILHSARDIVAYFSNVYSGSAWTRELAANVTANIARVPKTTRYILRPAKAVLRILCQDAGYTAASTFSR